MTFDLEGICYVYIKRAIEIYVKNSSLYDFTIKTTFNPNLVKKKMSFPFRVFRSNTKVYISFSTVRLSIYGMLPQCHLSRGFLECVLGFSGKENS